jgi:hypothetical protein
MSETKNTPVKEALLCVESIFNCQGWKEALHCGDPRNITEWMGPRLNGARDALLTAVNSHDELVSAAETALEYLMLYAEVYTDVAEPAKVLRTALRKAKGE